MIDHQKPSGMTSKNPLSAADLNAQFLDSKTALNDHLAEARTNVNLYLGNHFRAARKNLTRSLEHTQVESETKIRVTKNHTQTICKFIINSILGMAPTGAILPKNPLEIQDQKAAEIHKAVFEDFKYQNKFNDQIRRWVHDYVINGELVLNLFWDPNKGSVIGPQPMIDEKTGLPDPQRMQTIFTGDVECERIWCWDLRQDASAKSMQEAKWLGYEKMVDPDILRNMGVSDEALKNVKEDTDDTFKIFDNASGKYTNVKGKVLLRQMYWRPCHKYPSGYYAFFTKDQIVAQGELPKDHTGKVFFPIFYLGFDEIPTSPRSASIIKNIRHDQMEINRCASNIATIQQTLGMDKLITTTGGEVQADATKAGVRVLRVPGGKQSSEIVPGRSGDQFLGTMQAAISEMYQKCGVPEIGDEKVQDTDILASLYKNEKQKLRFSLYASKFADFLCQEIIPEILRLKKAYLPDEAFIRIVGKNEIVNIPEFRSMDDIGYQIKVEPGSEDLETRYGKQIVLTNTMQYLGQNLDKNTIGMILKQMPFQNSEEIYADYTLEYETARNIMLALDRGEMPPIVTAGNPDYFLKQLEHRKYRPDFRFLPPQIQQNYEAQVNAYRELFNQNTLAVQRAQAGFIPTDGPTVPVDGMYETFTAPDGTQKTKRVQVPQASVGWLLQQIAAQNNALGSIQTMPLGQQASLAGSLEQTMGAEMPEGMMNASGY